MQPRKLIERQLGFLIRQRKAHDDVLAAHLAPKSLRRPFLRLRSAQAFDPNEVPVGHEKRPRWPDGPKGLVAGGSERPILAIDRAGDSQADLERYSILCNVTAPVCCTGLASRRRKERKEDRAAGKCESPAKRDLQKGRILDLSGGPVPLEAAAVHKQIPTVTANVEPVGPNVGPVAENVPPVRVKVRPIATDVGAIPRDVGGIAEPQIATHIGSVASQVETIAAHIPPVPE
jgi:hypothetical protein